MRERIVGLLAALIAVAVPSIASASTAPTATVTPDHAQFWPYVDDGRRDEVRLRYAIDDPDGIIVDVVMPVGSLTVTDASHVVVRSFSVPPCDGCGMDPAEEVTIVWDGTDADGALVPPGTYTVTAMQTYHYVDPADGTTLREGSTTATAQVETFTGRLVVDETLVKEGAQTAARRCRVLGFYGNCRSVYSTDGGALLVTTWEEAVTLTYRFRLGDAVDVLDVRANHRRGNTVCRAYRVRHGVSERGVTITVSMGGQQLSQCWTRKVTVDVSRERSV